MTSSASIASAARLPRFERLPLQAPDDTPVMQLPSGIVARAEFLARIGGVAARLSDARSPVVLACRGTAEFAIAFCALLHARREIILPSGLQEDLLADPLFAGMQRLDDAFVQDSETRPLPPIAFDGNHAVTLFTSGSTGTPKRIAKTLRQLSAEADVLEATFGDRLASAEVRATVPHFHIYGALFRVIWPLAAGRVFHSEPVTTFAMEKQEDVLISSPAFLRRLPAESLARYAPPLVFSSGGQLPEHVAASLSRTCPVIEVYGSTETGGIGWREWPRTGGGNWTPFAGAELRVDEDKGRLAVRSPATGHAWVDSGDAANLHEDGSFTLLGRADGVLKIEDKRISLAALAEWMEQHALVEETGVVALAGSRAQLGAVIRLTGEGARMLATDGRTALIRKLRLHALKRFDSVLAPRKWRFVDELPFNAAGKLSQAALAALFERQGK